MKLFTAVLFLTFIGGTLGLTCYTCTNGAGVSTDTSACDDPFNPSTTDPNVFKVDCASVPGIETFDVCAKAKLTIDGSDSIGRACYSSDVCPAPNGCASGMYGGISAEICCCSGSYCNGAGYVAANLVTAVALLFAAMALTL